MVLSRITEIFNNREIAVAIWFFIFLLWTIIKSNAGDLSVRLMRQILHYRILVLYLLAISYAMVGVYILSEFDLWTKSQLKDTILWCIFTIFSTLLSLTKIKENKNYFRDAIKENFKLSVIIEFVAGVYAFNLALELFFVPFLALIIRMRAFAGEKKKYALLQKVLLGLLVGYGFLAIGHTIHEIIIHIRQFTSIDTLRDFLLSPILALWFLPYVYVMSIYMSYDTCFTTMSLRIKDKKILRFAKLKTFLYFNIDTVGLERWKKRLFNGILATKQDVVTSIKEIKRLQQIEDHPPLVSHEVGWSPYVAKGFLSSMGINTRYYINVYEKEWSASSDYVKIDDDFNGNTISYYIEGDETIAKNLHLVLNVINPANTSHAVNSFWKYANKLYLEAMAKPLPENICRSILNQKKLEMRVDKVKLIVRKEDWINQNKFSLMFYIQHD